ncbi:hypothetical protein ACLB2K_011847 [Fragaria x ananassa]
MQSEFRSFVIENQIVGYIHSSTGIKAGVGTDEKPKHSGDGTSSMLNDHGSNRTASSHATHTGVWTDRSWVFSTGLDQRVRCWHLQEDGKLIEYAYLVISVPEPEALDAKLCGRWVECLTVQSCSI